MSKADEIAGRWNGPGIPAQVTQDIRWLLNDRDRLEAVVLDLQRRLADMVEQRDAALAQLDNAGLLQG